jgi:uncharacterized protein (DUF488 family)
MSSPPAADPGPAVWTIGHSTRSEDELIELLRVHGVRILVDVRTVPRSRHNPQFDRDRLPAALERAGLAYRHEPSLGGLRKPRPDSPHTGWRNASFRGYADHMDTAEFQASLDALVALAEQGRVAIMCAEAVPWRCHRSLIADALTARGVPVRHIVSKTVAQSHRLTPFCRVVDGRPSYPGLA